MANKKITDLTALTTPDGADLLIIDDVSVTETKKITFANLTSVLPFQISLDGIANGVATSIGSIYIPAAMTISTNSLAYIGGSTASETAILKLVPIDTVTVSASWSRTNVLGSVALASPVALGVGWYDIILETGNGTQTGFARGLYITT